MLRPALYILTGASRGIGEAMARLLLARSPVLVTMARQANPALQACAEQHGAVLQQWPMDLADAASAARRLGEWLAAQQTDWGEACLINNAALLPPRIAPLSDTDANAIDTVLRLNLHAPMQLTAQFLRSTGAWAEASGVRRKVLNISSGLARVAMASMAPYSAAKAGVDQFTRCLAKEEARKPHGAKVCALAPGVVDTGMQQQMRGTAEQDFPDAAGFRFLHAAGRLLTAQAAAQMALDLLDSPDFGAEPLAELRPGPRARQG